MDIGFLEAGYEVVLGVVAAALAVACAFMWAETRRLRREKAAAAAAAAPSRGLRRIRKRDRVMFHSKRLMRSVGETVGNVMASAAGSKSVGERARLRALKKLSSGLLQLINIYSRNRTGLYTLNSSQVLRLLGLRGGRGARGRQRYTHSPRGRIPGRGPLARGQRRRRRSSHRSRRPRSPDAGPDLPARLPPLVRRLRQGGHPRTLQVDPVRCGSGGRGSLRGGRPGRVHVRGGEGPSRCLRD